MSFAHVALVVTVTRLVGVAVPAQVGAHHGEPIEQTGHDFAPHLSGLRIAMKQHHRIAFAADPGVDAHAVGATVCRAFLHEIVHRKPSNANSPEDAGREERQNKIISVLKAFICG
jgi:hypothetical protein